ncbi:hypothetical protein SAMN04489718_2646 [Actinopolyspora saharensis]|uniref:Uncharacterized protein n=1 Tax=Actinopolyspora saharensis TaxID=995062 RepID=A0A1H1ESG6_9ACTN|nr:hypothetical protein SAMN04489718_2646 [Actinopolyspora saharensis]
MSITKVAFHHGAADLRLALGAFARNVRTEVTSGDFGRNRSAAAGERGEPRSAPERGRGEESSGVEVIPGVSLRPGGLGRALVGGTGQRSRLGG